MPTPLNEFKREERIFSLLIGDSGSGKTSTIGYFPGKKLVIDIDRRAAGLLGHRNYPTENIVVEQFSGKNALNDVKHFINTLANLSEEKREFPYSTIQFDGFSSFDSLVIAEALKLAGSPEVKAMGGGKLMGDVYMPDWATFNYELQTFRDLMIDLKYKLPCNVQCSVYWADRYELGKIVGKSLALRKHVINEIITWFDEVYFFERKTMNIPTIGGESRVETRFIVHFRNDIARTTFAFAPDNVDWTNKDFYKLLMDGRAMNLNTYIMPPPVGKSGVWK
jgi:hypothetical protein